MCFHNSKENSTTIQGLFNDVQDKYFDHQFLYTDGSKDDQKVRCAVFSSLSIIKRRLPDQAYIYTAELHAIQLGLDVVCQSNKNKYIICVNSLSCLQVIDHGGRRSPAVACWTSDHWVAGSNPLRGSFVINFASLSPASAWPSLA